MVHSVNQSRKVRDPIFEKSNNGDRSGLGMGFSNTKEGNVNAKF